MPAPKRTRGPNRMPDSGSIVAHVGLWAFDPVVSRPWQTIHCPTLDRPSSMMVDVTNFLSKDHQTESYSVNTLQDNIIEYICYGNDYKSSGNHEREEKRVSRLVVANNARHGTRVCATVSRRQGAQCSVQDLEVL